jgi:hypothetical protein
MYEPEERPRSLTTILVPVGAVVVAALIIVGALFAFGVIGGGGDDEDDGGDTAVASPTVQATSTPAGSSPAELALGQYVRQTLQMEYSGDCSTASPGQSPATTPGTGATGPASTAGGLCSQARGEREGVQAFVLGQPLSEPERWAFVQQNGGAFQVIASPEITAESSAVPGTPWPLTPGATVVITGAAPCLNVREGPALNQAAVDCIPDGTTITIASGPAEADGYQWWQVEGRAGWVVSDYLRYEDATQ